MNTAKLNIIAKALKDELVRTQAVSLIQQAVSALQNQVSQPQNPNHQQQLSSFLAKLYKKLQDSPVEEFSPAWRDAMDELNVAHEFGHQLQDNIRSIFERNQITPQTALDELKYISAEISKTQQHLEELVAGLEYFGVGEDVLQKNECEVGIIIPRAYVKDNLKNFGDELANLEKTLLVFSELTTGQREPLHIRSISSSELSVFLDYAPEVAACIAVAVERIVALYKQLLEIKKLKLELVKQNVPEESLNGIDAHAASLVSPKLDELAAELIERYGQDLEAGRKNEVSIEIKHSLNKLANRIDRGFNVELRVAQDKTLEESDAEIEEAKRIALDQIVESASNINHIRITGEPVLFLPESKEH